ncbi:MAG TPA: formyltetrahydrofolate deformylase [Acidimicrobiales bacterium]
MNGSSPTAILLLSCPDQVGVVAEVAGFVARHGGNIVHAEQHTDAVDRVFFQRVEFELAGFDLARHEIEAAFRPIAERFAMRAVVRFSDRPTKVALLASKQPHCLYDLLTRWRTGELPVDMAAVVSNHADHAEAAAWFGVPYHHLPVSPGGKAAQEAEVQAVLRDAGVELVVLARYMQILSAGFVEAWADRVINIHHSFLPAFVGAKPYHQAHDRGVKIVGVTAHYATADLDEGPIIEQDVVRVSHRDSVEDLVRKGRDLEVAVLARAVRAHIEHRVLVYGRKTVVFG